MPTKDAAILIVEDESIVAKDIQQTLQGLGYTVSSTAASGEEAIQKAIELRPDLVLMDIMLRGELDGIEAAEEIHARFDIPVIFLTAHADDEILQRARVTEPFGYILKPFEERELYTNIEMALYKHQMEETLQQRNRELILLNRANQALSATLEQDQVLAILLEETSHILDTASISIWLVDDQGAQTDDKAQTTPRELICRQATGPGADITRGSSLALGEGIAGRVVASGESLFVSDTQTNEVKSTGQSRPELRSILSVPLQVKQEIIGALQAVDTKANRFKVTDLVLVESLAATAAIAIEHARLYEQARQDAETKAHLLREVSHRVKNNLSAIIGILYAERQHAKIRDQAIYQSIMQDLAGRVQGLAMVHSLLSTVEWKPLRLSDLTAQISRSSLEALPLGKHIALNVSPSPVRVTSDQAPYLALVINELVTNTVKHTLQERNTAHISVDIALEQDMVRFEFRDDGPGYPRDVLRLKRHSVGFDLIQSIVHDGLRGELALHNDHGAVALVRFKVQVPPDQIA